MEQPGRLHALFKSLQSTASPAVAPSASAPSLTGHPAVDEVLRTLAGADLARLLRYVRAWNASARTSGVAQRVLHAVVKLRAAEDVVRAFGEGDAVGVTADAGGLAVVRKRNDTGATALKDWVEAMIPYTERHLARMERLFQDSYVVDYMLGEMDDGIFDGIEDEDGVPGTGAMEVDRVVEVTA